MDEIAVARHQGASVGTWLKKFSPVRRFLVIAKITQVFLGVLFTRKGLFSAPGRQQFRGKARRSFLSLWPALSKKIQKSHGVGGGCTSCGASCNLMFQCPHWNPNTRLCMVYEDRPNVCRLFPVSPQDIKDRDLVRNDVTCGFNFQR